MVLSVADDMHGCGACDPPYDLLPNVSGIFLFYTSPIFWVSVYSPSSTDPHTHPHVFSKVTFCSFLLVRNLRVTSCHSLGDQVVDDVEKYFSILPLRRWRVTRDREEEKKTKEYL